MVKTYHVTALWDSEADVWISQTDIPGLNIEAETLGEFEQLVMELAPEMLSENENIHGAEVILDFRAQATRTLEVA